MQTLTSRIITSFSCCATAGKQCRCAWSSNSVKMTTLHKLLDEIVIVERQNSSLNILSWPYANINGKTIINSKTPSTLNTPKWQSENINKKYFSVWHSSWSILISMVCCSFCFSKIRSLLLIVDWCKEWKSITKSDVRVKFSLTAL